MNTARTSGAVASSGRTLVDWLTGTGFLMLHATCFFVALVVLIPWNLYTDPGDFWAADPLIRWAFLLAFHALLVGVWSLIRNVILKEDVDTEPLAPANRTWETARVPSKPVNFQTASPPGSAAATTASALLAEEWARQWLVDSGEEVASNGKPGSNGASGDVQRAATAPVEWPKPPEVTVTSIEEDTEPQIESPVQRPRTDGPLGAAARATNDVTESDDAVDPELEWRWIEAAASAWLTRKERESYTGGPQSFPLRPIQTVATP